MDWKVGLNFSTFIHCLQVKLQESEKEMLLASNKSLAEYNLSWEPKVNGGRQKLVELYQVAAKLDESLEEKEKEFRAAGGEVNVETAMVMLQSSAQQSEEECDLIVEKFMDGTLDVDTFIEEFQLKRKVANLRKIKADKIKELASKQKSQLSNATAITRPAPAPPSMPYFSSPPSMSSPQSHHPLPYPNNAPSTSLPYPLYSPNQGHSPALPYPMYPQGGMYPPGSMYPNF